MTECTCPNDGEFIYHQSGCTNWLKQPIAKRAWRVCDGAMLKAQFQFEPRDLWVGVFWRRTKLCLHVYICVLPLLPLHITLTTSKWIGKWTRSERSEDR